MAKALSSSPSTLIRKRTGGPGVKSEPCATITRRRSLPETNTCNGEISKVSQKEEDQRLSPTQVDQEVTGTHDSGSVETHVRTTEEGQTNGKDSGKEKEKEQDRSLGAVTSLVADYSDSDSDSGQ